MPFFVSYESLFGRSCGPRARVGLWGVFPAAACQACAQLQSESPAGSRQIGLVLLQPFSRSAF